MIRVIGEAPEAIKQATCRNCAARLEYTPSDVKERHGRDYSGGADGCRYIPCCRCNKEVVLEAW